MVNHDLLIYNPETNLTKRASQLTLIKKPIPSFTPNNANETDTILKENKHSP